MSRKIRRFHCDDAAETRKVFVQAVQIGAAERYTSDELTDWLPDPAMPDGWGDWLDRHTTFVAVDTGRITGFFMIEADGYLNMAFVRPECRGDGTADALYAAVLDHTRKAGTAQMTVLASRYAQGLSLIHGWRMAPELPPHEGLDPRQGPDDNPINRLMALELRA